MAHAIEVVVEHPATLGEGALWDPLRQQLYWVDIQERTVFVYDPSTGVNRAHVLPQRVGTVVPTRGEHLVVALEDRISAYDPATGALTRLTGFEEDNPDHRSNDGKVDPAGRFWVGSMVMRGRPGGGALYRLDPDLQLHKMATGITVSNGLVWSRDATTMYYIDTPTRCVVAYNYDHRSGALAGRRIVVRVGDDMGMPDGMAIDSDDRLWVALFGGAGVGCWNPDTGALEEKIEVPAANVTSCAFGGLDLQDLYITTARIGADTQELAERPLAGSLLRTRPGATGVGAAPFDWQG